MHHHPQTNIVRYVAVALVLAAAFACGTAATPTHLPTQTPTDVPASRPTPTSAAVPTLAPTADTGF